LVAFALPFENAKALSVSGKKGDNINGSPLMISLGKVGQTAVDHF
jgi:hypothetical protein